MKTRLLSLLALMSVLALVAASPAPAAKRIPPITQTGPYKQLKTYVADLRSKADLPATPQRRAAYKAKLKNKVGAARTKVNNLFKQRSNRALVDERRQYKAQAAQVKQEGQEQVARIKSLYADRINQMQADANAAVNRVNDRYAPKINSRQDQINRLRRKLLKTDSPAKRQAIQRQIDQLQRQVDQTIDARNDAVDAVRQKYQTKINRLVGNQNDRIALAQKQTKLDLQSLQQKFKGIYNREIADIRAKKQSENGMVSDLATQGYEYISEMPDPGTV